MNREELLKNAKPILFNTEMVQAILEGRKTVTRRNPFKFEMKEGYNPDWSGYSLGEYYTGHIESGVCLYSRGAHDVWGVRSNVVKAPYKVGDILYVRETWQRNYCNDAMVPGKYAYKASPETWQYFSEEEKTIIKKWKPSIHMPKVAARIFLKVTDVRVERLQDITVEQIEKEGIYAEAPYTKEHFAYRPGMVIHFSRLWDGITKKQDLDKYGWDANPWVFVISFIKISKEEVLKTDA